MEGGEGDYDSAILIYDTNWNLKHVVTEGEPYFFEMSGAKVKDSGYIKLTGEGTTAYAHFLSGWQPTSSIATNLELVREYGIYTIRCTASEGWLAFQFAEYAEPSISGTGGAVGATYNEVAYL